MDEVDLDVVPLDICGIVLGSPYLYDRKAIFYREQNKYHLFKYGVEYIVRAHKINTNLAIKMIKIEVHCFMFVSLQITQRLIHCLIVIHK